MKEPKFGCSSRATAQDASKGKGQLESLAIASMAVPGQTPSSSGTQFGGGTGSGGGAGGNF